MYLHRDIGRVCRAHNEVQTPKCYYAYIRMTLSYVRIVSLTMSLFRHNHSYDMTEDQVEITDAQNQLRFLIHIIRSVGLCSGNLHKLIMKIIPAT